MKKKTTAIGNLYSELGCAKTLCEVDVPQSRQQLRAQMLRYRAIIADRVSNNANRMNYTTIHENSTKKSWISKANVLGQT